MSTRTDQPGVVHIVTRGINLKTVASTTIVPSHPNSRRFIINRIYVVVVAGSGLTVSPTLRVSSVGNSGSAGDVTASTTLSNLNFQGANILGIVASTNTAWSLASGTGSINLDITVGATATTATADVHVIGFYT